MAGEGRPLSGSAQALFGERRLTDGRLAPLNRPGDRNGSYDSPAPTQTIWSATLVTEVMYRDGSARGVRL